MWIVFGWQKEEKPLGHVATGYCYDCHRTSNWVVWNQAEWATLSDIRVLKFLSKHFLRCDGCSAVFELFRQEFRSIDLEIKRQLAARLNFGSSSFASRWQPKKNTEMPSRGRVRETPDRAYPIDMELKN